MARAIASMAAVATALSAGLLVPEPATAQFAYEVVRSFPAELASPQARLLQGTDGAFYGTTAGRPLGDTANGGGVPTIFALRPRAGGGYRLEILHEFGRLDGPAASLIQALDGNLYGTTMGSGVGDGMVFKVSPAGAFTVLHTFTLNEGNRPLGGLVQATDGNFYGTTSLGGARSRGTVFRVTTDGALTTLYSFTGVGDGEEPIAGLIQATDGGLYGITQSTIFRITTDGTLTTVYTFSGFDQSLGRLVQGTDGDFYGVTFPNFFVSQVKAFKVTAGGILTFIHTFTSEGSPSPLFQSYEPLMQASDGNFYGTMANGGIGPDFGGTAYRMTPAGDVTVLHAFTPAEGMVPLAGLRQAQDGRLYGVTSEGGPLGRGTVFSLDLAGAFATVQTFQSQEGCGPWAGLVQTSDDAFYGTTAYGGLANKGTVYRMTGDGTVTTLHSFTGLDGAFPMASLLLASDGNFYGTTANGGASDQGTVFRMTPAGVVTALHSFAGSDGAFPWAPLIEVSAGNLHGTTTKGGPSNLGTLFRMSFSGSFVSYHSFTLSGPNSPVYPVGPLLQARDGSLYGTGYGFNDVGAYAGGSVFKVTPRGVVVLNSGFTSDHITAGLTEASDGNFYSASFGAHTDAFNGSVFKTTPQGVRTVLHNFDFLREGTRPFNAPIEASDGNFYGTTNRQLRATGSVYQLTPGGVFTTLKVLSEVDGGQPAAKLLQASDGAVYGAAYSGGSGGCGLVFRFAIP